MLPAELKHFTLIPAAKLTSEPGYLPDKPGVYLFFVRGGDSVLASTSYFETGGESPLRVRKHVHLYTGAARFSLVDRVLTNLHADVTSSSFCRSLLAIERMSRAISRSGTPDCAVVGERTLRVWLRRNALVGFEATDDPFGREHELLASFASPLNIALRRDTPHSRVLSEWRCTVFPPDQPQEARRIRYL